MAQAGAAFVFWSWLRDRGFRLLTAWLRDDHRDSLPARGAGFKEGPKAVKTHEPGSTNHPALAQRNRLDQAEIEKLVELGLAQPTEILGFLDAKPFGASHRLSCGQCDVGGRFVLHGQLSHT